MEVFIGIIVFLSWSAVIVWSILHSYKEESAKRDKEFIDRIRRSSLERKSSICIEVDGCKIMLKEDFIKREWYKTKEGGIPVRGQYEPAAHFLKRVDEYRKMKAEQKRHYDEEFPTRKIKISARMDTSQRFFYYLSKNLSMSPIASFFFLSIILAYISVVAILV